MAAIRVKTRIPESRQVTLTLPPEFPVGEAELEIAVCEPVTEFTVTLTDDYRPKAFPARPTNPALAAEHDALERMLPDLMERYAGKYVALRGGQVIAVGDTEVATLTAAYRSDPTGLVLVRRVTDAPQPIERIPSFRPVPPG